MKFFANPPQMINRQIYYVELVQIYTSSNNKGLMIRQETLTKICQMTVKF